MFSADENGHSKTRRSAEDADEITQAERPDIL
jgi:hypothetical protein